MGCIYLGYKALAASFLHAMFDPRHDGISAKSHDISLRSVEIDVCVGESYNFIRVSGSVALSFSNRSINVANCYSKLPFIIFIADLFKR